MSRSASSPMPIKNTWTGWLVGMASPVPISDCFSTLFPSLSRAPDSPCQPASETGTSLRDITSTRSSSRVSLPVARPSVRTNTARMALASPSAASLISIATLIAS